MLPHFNEAFNFIRGRQTRAGEALPPLAPIISTAPSERLIVTSSAQAPRMAPAVVPRVSRISVAGTSRGGGVRVQPPPLYDYHIAPTPYPQRPPNPARAAPYPRIQRLQNFEMQARIQYEIRRQQRRYQALVMAAQRDETVRPHRPWSQPPPLDVTSANHQQEERRCKSLPPTMTLLPTGKVPNDEIEHFWNDIMELISADLENVGLEVKDLDLYKPPWSL